MKAVLIMDMPDCCMKCKLVQEYWNGYYCGADDEDRDVDDTRDEKPKWCPLQELLEET